MNEVGLPEFRCPRCGEGKFQLGRLGLLSCTRCGLTVSATIWKRFANETLEHDWFGDGYQPQPSCWVKRFEFWNIGSTLKRLAGAKPTGRRLLEIGVSSGSLLQAVQERGFEVMGCDLSPTLCERVKRRGVPMYCGPIAKREGAARFDVVVMNHVLEHFDDPVALLRDVVRLLAPGGVVHIPAPNVACLEATLSGWSSCEPYHLPCLTPATLRNTVLASGFAVEREKTHESFSAGFWCRCAPGWA